MSVDDDKTVRNRTGGTSRHGRAGGLWIAMGGVLVLAAGGLAGAYLMQSSRAEASSTGASADEHGAPASADKASSSLTAYLAAPVTVKIADRTVTVPRSELGIVTDGGELGRVGSDVAKDPSLQTLAQKGGVPVMVDRAAAEAELRKLAGRYNQAPIDAFLDLENRTIHDDVPGRGIDLWAALPALEAAARSGQTAIELPTVAIPGRVTKADLGIDDISHVLGTYTTKFATSDKDRNFNLKLAASKLNGFVMKPHVEFSFNGVVGERSEKEGYKIAHVITAGEMVDGLAGGTCQISTTLFGASFFAGLDIVKTTNHSRPSTYTPLGFDATVVWPDTDLVLENPYDFPVVIHYRVAAGEAVVEILGKERPWDKIVFERHVTGTTPYTTEERLDDTMPEGATWTDQGGFDGYKLTRTRKFFKNGEEVTSKTEHWSVSYKPVVEYIRKGTSTDPNAKMPTVAAAKLPTAPSGDSMSISQ